MTDVYSAEQLNELGAAIGNAIQYKADETIDEVNRLISEIEPSDNGSNTTTPPNGAGGMYLDDGREIKHKFLTGELNGLRTLEVPHGLANDKILSYRVLINHKSAVGYAYESNTESQFFHYVTNLKREFIVIQPQAGSSASIENSTYRILITYIV